MKAYEVLAARAEEVMRRWRESVRGSLAPDSMPPIELNDAIPTFIQEVVSLLRSDEGLPLNTAVPEKSGTAAGHGGQRLRLGFSLSSVVREYGALQQAIVATVREAGTDLTVREMAVLSDAMVTGIAKAVTQYTQERDAELVRQANEHFAFIAHELRNPLSSSLFALQLLKKTGQLPVESRTVGALERGLRCATDLVERTLTIPSVGSGIELRRQPTTLQSLFADAEADAVSEADAKGIALRVSIEKDGSVSVDKKYIHSAVSNLLRNAVKFTPPSGAVELRGKVAGGRATIEVEDGCGGLPPGSVEKAFYPVVRMEKGHGGFGLGLAIAKQAVDAHGGTIRIQNLPGKGCIFVLEFPADAA